jgi:CHASE2 domain-containing sensor protein
MARPRASRAKAVKHRGRAMRVLLGLVYLLAIVGLVTWELRDRFDEINTSCPGDNAVERTSAYAVIYRWVFHHANMDSANQVSLVVFPADLQDIHSNVCVGRSYMADVLRLVAAQNPSEIVIDRFYGPNSCKAFPQATAELVSVIQSLKVPVVIGEHADKSEELNAGACLVRTPQLDFGSSFVHRGIVSLNSQLEKIPLQWNVLSSEQPEAKVETPDSLSWAAVKAYDPDYARVERIQDLVNSHRHPFVNLNFTLPSQTSTQLFCATGTEEMRKRWSVECTGPVQPPRLLGRIVVIGSETLPDRHPVLGRQLWGVDLQARYIQALLSGRYLRAVTVWFSFIVFGVFVFLIEGLPAVMEAYTPSLKKHPIFSHAFPRRRFIWVTASAVALIVFTSATCLVLGYLPPLAAFGDIFLLACTRLLIFTVEFTEVPLLHSN